MKKILLFALTAVVALSVTSCAEKKNDIKVISYNVRVNNEGDGENKWDLRKHASIAMIRDEKPTIFGLQEAKPEQMQYLVENLPEYGYIGVGREDGVSSGEHMTIFYLKDQVELLDGGTFWLSDTPDQVSKGWDAQCFRTCTWGKFKMKSSGKKFIYMNTHLDHMGKIAREESIKLLVERAEALAGDSLPVFITADFNAATTNAIFRPMQAVMLDARQEATVTDERGTLNCWGTTPPGVVIDHIFYRNAEAQKFEVLRDKDYGAPYVSDHYPVMLTAIM